MWTPLACGIIQPKLMKSSIRSLGRLAIANEDQRNFEIVEIGVEEGVDLGFRIKDSLFSNVLI